MRTFYCLKIRVRQWLLSCNVADRLMDGERPYQLRDAAEMIRKSDDCQKVVKGLQILPALIEAAPDELANYSGEHCEAT